MTGSDLVQTDDKNPNEIFKKMLILISYLRYEKFDNESRLKRIKLLMTGYFSTRNFGFLEISGVLYGHCVSKLT